MAQNVTLQNLRDLTRLYADERPESSNSFLTSTELNTLVNLECRALYDRLVAARGHDYYESESTFTTTSGTATYAFSSMTPTATAVYQVRRVQIEWGTNDIEEVHDFKKNEELDLRNYGTWGAWTPKGFRVVGANLKLVPTPTQTGKTVRVLYIPAFTDLASNGDTFDAVNGWHDAVALGVAAKILDLQNIDSSKLIERRMEVLQRIDELAADRAADEPARVVNVYPEGDFYHRRHRRLPRP